MYLLPSSNFKGQDSGRAVEKAEQFMQGSSSSLQADGQVQGTKRPHDSLAELQPAQGEAAAAHLPATQPVFSSGQQVFVFHRFQQNKSRLLLPVSSVAAGQCSPRIGVSDCWMPATVVADFPAPPAPPALPTEEPRRPHPSDWGVRVRYHQRLWFDVRGNMVDLDRHPDATSEWVTVDQVAPLDQPRAPPKVTFVVVRWGGEVVCDPVVHGDGGWGPTGSNVSDPYVRYFFEEVVWKALGPHYQVMQ